MNSAEEMDPSESKKRNLARKKVQEEMDQLRIKIRQLRKEEKAGKGRTRSGRMLRLSQGIKERDGLDQRRQPLHFFDRKKIHFSQIQLWG